MPKAIVFEEFTHVCPTGNGWVVGLEDWGYEVYKLSSHQYRLQELDEFIDLIIVHNLDPQKAEDIKHIKNSYPKTKIAVLGEGYIPLCDEMANYVDLWLSLCKTDKKNEKEFTSRNMPFGYIQLASHPRLINICTAPEANKEFDISFIGTFAHGYRNEDKFLYPLMEKYKGCYAGFSYKGNRFNLFPYNQIPVIYSKTKINLNFHYPFNTGPDRIDLAGRTFDIAMSGNFQLSDHWLAKEYFGDSIGFGTSDDWEDKVKYYLSHESERTRMAQKSYEICLREHTYTQRIKSMLSLLKIPVKNY